MKPEPDPVLCSVCNCPDPTDDLVATPEGPMCRSCSRQYERQLEEGSK
jgi:hypothetical protein